jgi:LCP family protein required for cell wall assembly
MPDRPRNGGPEDGPDYTWLYGKGGKPQDPQATRPVPRPDRRATPGPDETRVMKAQPRPGQPRPSGRPASRPTPPPVAPPPAPPASASGRRRPRFRIRYVFIVLLLWLAYLVVVPVMAWRDVEKVDWEPDGDRPKDQPGTTYLLVGSDSRAGLSKEERKELNTGNAAGGRTDTMMLLHTGSGPNLLLSIPRDSIVDIPDHGTTKINAAYAFGGAPLLVQTIEQNTGIRIDDYVEIGMGGVAGLVDAVGGIEVCPKQDMKDKLAGLDIEKGCQEVDGTTALAYARSRHASATGDIDRVRRQREVVAAVGKSVLSPWSVLNPVRYWRLNHEIPDFFAFGDGMGPVRSAMWATAMTRVDGDKGLTCVVPLQDLAVHWDPDKAPEMFDKIQNDDTDSIDKDLCSDTGGIQ